MNRRTRKQLGGANQIIVRLTTFAESIGIKNANVVTDKVFDLIRTQSIVNSTGDDTESIANALNKENGILELNAQFLKTNHMILSQRELAITQVQSKVGESGLMTLDDNDIAKIGKEMKRIFITQLTRADKQIMDIRQQAISSGNSEFVSVIDTNRSFILSAISQSQTETQRGGNTQNATITSKEYEILLKKFEHLTNLIREYSSHTNATPEMLQRFTTALNETIGKPDVETDANGLVKTIGNMLYKYVSKIIKYISESLETMRKDFTKKINDLFTETYTYIGENTKILLSFLTYKNAIFISKWVLLVTAAYNIYQTLNKIRIMIFDSEFNEPVEVAHNALLGCGAVFLTIVL
jgi:hypothetical protein